MAEVIVQNNGKGISISKKKLIRVDMTPMVDLGFLLITFFMFTTSFDKPNVMDLGLPAGEQTDNVVVNEKNQITFILGENNRVFYHQSSKETLNENNMQETNFDGIAMSKVIEKAYHNAPNKDVFTVIVKPTDDSNYKNFVDVLDNLAIAKKERYGITDIRDWEKSIYESKTK